MNAQNYQNLSRKISIIVKFLTFLTENKEQFFN